MSSNVFVPTQFANQYSPSASFNRGYHPSPEYYNSDGSTVVINYQPICLNIENANFNNQTFFSDDDTLYAPQSLNAPNLYAPQTLSAQQPQIAHTQQPQIAYTQQPQIAYTQQPFYLQPPILAPQPVYTHQQPINQNNLSYNWGSQPLDLNLFGNMNVNNSFNSQPLGFNPVGNLSRSYLPFSGTSSLQPNYSTQRQQPNFGIQQQPNFGLQQQPNFGIQQQPNFGFSQQPAIIPGSLNPWGLRPF